MKKEELSRLLDKYYKGESSEKEDLSLKEYFNRNNIDEGYEAEKEIFSHFSLSGDVPEPSANFEGRIVAAIDEYEKNSNSRRISRVVLYSVSTAAALLILAGSYFFLNTGRELKDTFSDPKIAYAETMKVLTQVSKQLNQGSIALEPLGKINKMTEKTFESVSKSSRLIKKSMKSIDNLDKAAGIAGKPVDMNKIK